jgi:MATE family multidrug resistance protein
MAVPGALLGVFEWWAFEIMSIMAGLISVNALGAHFIIY